MMNSWWLLAAVAGLLFVISSATNTTDCEEFYRPDGPQITPCKEEIILQNGQNYTIICRANTPVEFIQQEPAEEKVGNFSSITQGNFTDENAEYEYEAYLELNYVDRYAIGFYACVRKDSVIKKDLLNQLVAEPINNANISYIYIYVNGTDSLFAPMREVVMGKEGYYVAECKPTTPDVEVDIVVSQNKPPNYLMFSPKIGFVMRQCSKIAYKCLANKTGSPAERKTIRWKEDYQLPTVIGNYHEFLLGEQFFLNCSANYTQNSAVHLEWNLPDKSLKVIEDSNNNAVTEGIVYRNISIVNASREYAGNYTCIARSHCGDRGRSFIKKFLGDPYLKYKRYDSNKKDTRQATATMSVTIFSYPPATYTFYKGDVKLENNDTFEITIKEQPSSTEATLKIHWRDVTDSDNYTLTVSNGHPKYDKNFTDDIKFKVAPTVVFETSDKTCVVNTKTKLLCQVIGHPEPDVTWFFNNGSEQVGKVYERRKFYDKTEALDVMCLNSGTVTCKANNSEGGASKTRRLIVYELPDGFGIYNQSKEKVLRFSEHQVATIKCVASIHYFTNVSWEKDGEKLDEMVEYTQNQFSLVARIRIDRVSMNHTGKYVCRGERMDNTTTFDDIDVKVSSLQAPQVSFKNDIDGNVQTYQPIHMYCLAQGVPRPEVKWYKDTKEFVPLNDTNIEFENYIVDYQTVNSSIFIKQMKEENRGEYECVAHNSVDEVRTSAILTLKEAAYIKYVIAIAIIVFVLIILLIYLTCKVKKEKRFRKELAAAGLLYFKEGVTKSLNPDLGIDEQAELLPYNEKFEFPADKLKFGKQLGAGAFGVVYKADARGIINAEETTPVAVKMVKKTADNMYIKALASELKIMVHLGKHINIVNLLGACTKNVGKRELVVIVEYCKFGNIHNYMQRHREVFIDQFSDTSKEKSFGKVNRGYDSSGSTGLQSDYGTANTQDTDHTFLTNNTNRTSRKNVASQPAEVKVSEGYVQPEWRSNYESDYSYDGRSPRPLTSRDLLAWAFQIARGMEYLASRKVLHGDLAARNILLADDNIVKICDFGLARSIYKNDEYQKKENSLLPVKWLAIECMTDRIFSTQSDVWSFGIVLWELFTLAKTPYPNMSPAHLLHFLREGHRLEKPAYSDDRIYNLMKRCWEEKPTTRPSFTQLQETLGTFLEDNVRNHYVDLNTAYMDGNAPPEGQEDYLAMVSAPDYNNMVTPSPHHYVNEVGDPRRFFPPSPSKDEDGYLQMSPANIFSPKSSGTKFDFDPRKFNTRPSEASSGGSELTPMLTLNNLPRSGSDSDHEGNVSPFPNICPRIEEEPDEVFDNKQSKKTLNQNAKNAQITNATNPMYITFDLDVEKKPIDNSYVNIVPNGLVK